MIAALQSVLGGALVAAFVGALADPRAYENALRTLIAMTLAAIAAPIIINL